jgi:hypothetical protein
MNNYEFYITLFSSIFLFFSETLPFLPCKSNGIVHSFINLISSIKDKNSCIENTNNFIKEIENKETKKKDTENENESNSTKESETNSTSRDESKNSSLEISVLIESDSDSSTDEDYEFLKKRLYSILNIIDEKKKYDHTTKIKINHILKEINNL